MTSQELIGDVDQALQPDSVRLALEAQALAIAIQPVLAIELALSRAEVLALEHELDQVRRANFRFTERDIIRAQMITNSIKELVLEIAERVNELEDEVSKRQVYGFRINVANIKNVISSTISLLELGASANDLTPPQQEIFELLLALDQLLKTSFGEVYLSLEIVEEKAEQIRKLFEEIESKVKSIKEIEE